MILIVVKFETKPEFTESFPERVRAFTEATRAEPGNKWFEWNKSLEEPNVYTLVEAFDDEGAGPHVSSDHFKQAMIDMKPLLATTPHIISRSIDGEGWDRMGELQVD
ncbi:MAG: putative quinol monooxygenase [Pseudoclavibacter sp.]